MIFVVMGVTGSGKSTVGKLLAKELSIPFIEGDDFHSQENVLKMSHGIPLDDNDRYPWLKILSKELQIHQDKGAVLACSALKEEYRQLLQQGLQQKITWIYLKGSEELIQQRMKNREGHFMPETLLHSQFVTLEAPPDAYTVSIEKDPKTIADEIITMIGKKTEKT